ncbi:MAG: hypothetical protein ACRD2T_01105, partial [Thermoanaerobaculia bacterium]
LGFDPGNFFILPQPFFGGFLAAGGRVVPAAAPPTYPYGHGYSTQQLVHRGAAWRYRHGALVPVEDDALAVLGREGGFLVRTHRINDLTQLTPLVLDLDRLAAGRVLIDRGAAAAIELVANPGGQKGGNWVRRHGGSHRFLVEGMNAKEGGWPDFLERHRGAPYNAFRNLYDGPALRSILLSHALPDHLRVRKLPPAPGGGPAAGLFLESVTGDLSQVEAARAAAFRKDEEEVIQDLKELKDLPRGVGFVARQDGDEEIRRLLAGQPLTPPP